MTQGKTNVLKVSLLIQKRNHKLTLERFQTYKSYSGKEKEIGLINSINFINNQIKNYKKREGIDAKADEYGENTDFISQNHLFLSLHQ